MGIFEAFCVLLSNTSFSIYLNPRINLFPDFVVSVNCISCNVLFSPNNARKDYLDLLFLSWHK